MHTGKTLLGHIDSEEHQRILADRKFEMPNYRTGDVLDITLYSSLSEGKFNTLRGLVTGKKMENNLRHTMTFHAVGDDTNFTYSVKVNSPMLANVKLYKYGSN
jgi:ribosomal protein L19